LPILFDFKFRSVNPVIKVENISKSYVIRHQRSEGYSTLRETITAKTKNVFTSKPDSQVERSELFWALKDVSFEVKQGDRMGIIGRNGAGKSTLLKILSRITEPTTGKISIKGRIASLLEVGTGFHPELTGRENIFLNGSILGMGKSEIKNKFDEIVAFAEIEKFLDTPVKRYSSGMYVRLAFAVAAHLDSEVLIMDEVLAVGDSEFQKKCLAKMKDVSNDGRTILFVSHNMAAIKQICSHAILLNKGSILKAGKITDVIDAYQEISESGNNAIEDFSKREGSGVCRIFGIKIMSSAGIEKSVFQLGEKIKFILSVKNESGSKVEGLRIIIGVYNSYNEAYLRFDTRNTNIKFTCDGDSMEVTCTLLEHLNIKPDVYSVNVAMLRDEGMVDYIANMARFSIDNFDYFESGRDIENPELAKVYYRHAWNSN
jgi:lipopolysaccharide transport system ATP-binding protein